MEVELTHLFTFFRSLGGVQTVLRHHHRNDPQHGIQSRFIIFFETERPTIPRVGFLGLSWRSTIWSARKRFQNAVSQHPIGVAVYVNCWGMPFLADLDGAARRIAVLHTHYPDLESDLRRQAGLLDGVLCVTASLARKVRTALPDLPEQRIELLPVPVSVPDRPAEKGPLTGRKMILGFSGRVSKEQKRVDRFPELIRCLEQAGIDFRLDIVGEGPQRAWLQRQFRHHPRVRIYGKLLGDDYWEVLARWDFTVFVSDYEGLPITMLEAMSLGALPLYPAIGSGGDAYAATVRSDLLYPPNDFRQLAVTLGDLRHASPDQMKDLRQRARAATEQHLGNKYGTIFSSFTKCIVERPRISKSSFPRRPFFLTDYCPFGLLRRLYREGFFRRNDDLSMRFEKSAAG